MLELEIGEVRSFNAGKLFGFVEVLDEEGQKTGEQLFFHFNNGAFVDTFGDDIQFVGRTITVNGRTSPMWYPSVGEKLAFDRGTDNRGRECAERWTYAEAYQNRVRKLTEPFYRVIWVLGIDGDEFEYLFWEGQGHMTAQYPVRVLDGRLNDPLASSINPETGSTNRYYFQVWVPEDTAEDQRGITQIPGYWERCDDPRYMSSDARKLKALG
jgi:hypothetical protein